MVNNAHRDFVITAKVLNEISEIKQFIEGMTVETYLQDNRTQKAVAMTLINIGELCGAYSEAFLREHSDVPWKEIRALRNIAAHKYEKVCHTDVWETIISDIPALEAQLQTTIGLTKCL